MLTSLLMRALPFMMTLIIGTGMGSIFGFRNSTTKQNDSRVARHMRNHGGGGPGRGLSCESNELKIMFQPDTSYTPEALKHKTTGVVTLLVRFDTDGTAKVIERLSTLPDGLTEDAERVVEGTQFIPAMVNGRRVPETREMHFPYSMSDRATAER